MSIRCNAYPVQSKNVPVLNLEIMTIQRVFLKHRQIGKWEWECPEGYHDVNDDETDQCYPNSEGCPDWADYPIYVFEEPISESDSYSCRALHSLCLRDEPAHSKCDEFLEGYEKEFGEN